MSPYLFLFCGEVLTRLLGKTKREEGLHRICIARACSPITHLMFADDTFLFVRASVKQAKILLACLVKFLKWSTRKINFGKSGVVFSDNLVPRMKGTILDYFQMKTLGSKERYLGNPLFFTISKVKVLTSS